MQFSPRSLPLGLRAGPGHRITCRVVPLHAEPSPGPLLAHELAREMPAIEFTFLEGSWPDALWVCGYERGHAHLVHNLRTWNSSATLVVTGRGPVEVWGAEVREAGADHVCHWPVDYAELARLLQHPHLLHAGPRGGAG